jgi:hypothetical protein
MAEKSGFFDAHLVNGEYDRVYLAESFAKYFASFIGNGIFGGKSNELMVQQNTTADMSIKILSGQAWINGYWYENDAELSLAIDVADGVLNRTDIIVLRWDNSERVIRLAVKKGTPAVNASVPIIQRNADFYELMLAKVYVKAGTAKITQADIVDTRLDNEVCGFVHGVIQQFDTTEFGKQIDSFIENFEASSAAKMQAVFDRINALIDADMATRLTLDVDNLLNETALATQTLGYSKKNLIPYPYYDSTKETNGITWTNNNDGSVTANGTATDDSYYFLYRNNIILPAGKYFVTSNVDDSSKLFFTYALLINKTDGTGVKDAFRSYDVLPFEITESDIKNYNLLIGISVLKGATVTNLTFKPMIRRAEILDDTWEPYKLSVAETIQEDEQNIGCFYRINRKTKTKEWLNPPCVPGVEYKLAERWNNKPIYQMTIYAASLPNNSGLLLETNANWDRIVSAGGYALDKDDLTSYPFPVTLHNQVVPIAVISRIEGDGSLIITTNGDASYLEAYITIKYTKSN